MNRSTMFAYRRALVVAALFSLPLGLAAQELPRAKPSEVGLSQERLEKIMVMLREDTAKGTIVPGATFLVARHGKVAFFDVAGVLDPATKAPMTRDAIFRIYSMSKPITTVTAMTLFEEGKIALQDPLSKYIPDFAPGKLKVGVEKPGEGGGKPTSSWFRTAGRSPSKT